MWEIDYSEEYQSWFLNLDEAGKEAVFQRFLLLQEFGGFKMKDAIKMMESAMSPESIKRARIKAEQEIFTLRLAKLREELNIKQLEMLHFNQSSVSKIEKRKDIKLSTLIDYLDSLGMGLEIRACSKNAQMEDTLLLKI